MYLQLLKIFVIVALFPIVFFAVGASFLMNDIAMMNPLGWVVPAKIMTLVWIGTVLLCMMMALSDAQ